MSFGDESGKTDVVSPAIRKTNYWSQPLFTQDQSVVAMRRAWLRRAAALLAAVATGRALPAVINGPALLDNEAGAVRFLPAGGVFCAGAVPLPGHEIVHALLREWTPLDEAWARIDAYLKGIGRPVQALCGMELRIPGQLSLAGFRAFNAPYIEQLRKRDLLVGNYAAVCRTNVAPADHPPAVPMLHAFSYTIPSAGARATFCISGTADLDPRGNPVAPGDISASGMRQRLQHCVATIGERLDQLELSWDAVTHVDLCMATNNPAATHALDVLPPAARRHLRRYDARPPIVGTEVELECRAAARELTVEL